MSGSNRRTGWAYFRGWPLSLIITVAVLILVSALVNQIDAVYRIF